MELSWMTDKSGSTSQKAERTKTVAAVGAAEGVAPEASGITIEEVVIITEEGIIQIEGGITDTTKRGDTTTV